MAERIILVGGGARSGKSRFALSLAVQRGQRRTFVATAQAHDAEMQQRIDQHRLERGDAFRTLEAGTDIAAVLDANHDCDVLVIDCLTLHLSNLLLHEFAPSESTAAQSAVAAAAAAPGAPEEQAARPDTERRVLHGVEQLLGAVQRHPACIIVVSNEVGMGIVPMSPLGRVFRDLAGRANQLFAAHADEIYFAALGVILRLKPDPLQALPPGFS